MVATLRSTTSRSTRTAGVSMESRVSVSPGGRVSAPSPAMSRWKGWPGFVPRGVRDWVVVVAPHRPGGGRGRRAVVAGPAHVVHPQAHARRGRHHVLRRGRQAVVPAGRAAARRAPRPDLAPSAPRGGGGGGPPLLPATRGSTPSAWPGPCCANVTSGGVVEGGSTLTQQLARTLFLSNTRTYARKVKEAALAVMLEEQLTKDQILELYLNRVYLSAGVYGVEAMSRKLFVKQARDLNAGRGGARSPASSARPPPSRRGPTSTAPSSAATWCCARMREEGYITAARGAGGAPARSSGSRPAPAWPTPAPATRRSSCASSSATASAATTRRTGRCTRRFVPAIQEAAEHALARRAAAARHPRAPGARSWPSTRARATSWPWWAAATSAPPPFNRAANSRRQPGSAFKPFVYAAALERGLLAGVRAHRPARGVGARAGRSGRPATPAATRRTRRRCARPCYQSNNQAAVALQQKVGTGHVQQLAAPLGLRDQPEVPSLALGTGERDAAGADRRLRRLSQRRLGGEAARPS